MRANTRRFLEYWKSRVKTMGRDIVMDELLTGPPKTKLLDRKDRMELLRELGLRGEK